MEDLKKKLEEIENKINQLSEGYKKEMDLMKNDLNQSFIHNFDKMINSNKEKEEIKEEPKKEEKIKLEDF